MTREEINKSILDAVDIMTKQAIKEAGITNVIQATVIGLVNSTEGKYKLRYQQSDIIAYAINTEVTYIKGKIVNVLLPNGDINNSTKVILGASSADGISYVKYTGTEDNSASTEKDKTEEKATVIDDDASIGKDTENAIVGGFPQKLCPFVKGGYTKVVYDSQAAINKSSIKNEILVNGLKNCKALRMELIVGSPMFSTGHYLLASKTLGNLGYNVYLAFEDNITKKRFTRKYTIDTMNHFRGKTTGGGSDVASIHLTGQPIRIVCYYALQDTKFIEVEKIECFCKDFPVYLEELSNTTKYPPSTYPYEELKDEKGIDLAIYDCWLNSLKGVAKMPEEEKNWNISIKAIDFTPRYIDSNSKVPGTINENARLEAVFEIDGKRVPTDQYKTYWYLRSPNYRTSGNGYRYVNAYAGEGWGCINPTRVLAPHYKNKKTALGTFQQPTDVITPLPTNTLRFSDVENDNKGQGLFTNADERTVKCVIVYQGKIYNPTDMHIPISLHRADGTVKPSLLQWGIYYEAQEREGDPIREENAGYNFVNYGSNLIIAKDTKKGLYLKPLPNQSLYNLDACRSDFFITFEDGTVEFFDSIESEDLKSVMENTDDTWVAAKNFAMYRLDLHKFPQIATISAVLRIKEGNLIYSTTDIDIKNTTSESMTVEEKRSKQYNLDIPNKLRIFNYTNSGKAAFGSNIIKVLRLRIIDEKGTLVNIASIPDENITWYVPKNNTMINTTEMNKSEIPSAEDSEFFYYQQKELTYVLQDNYNAEYINNTISVMVKYQDQILRAETMFVFMQAGSDDKIIMGDSVLDSEGVHFYKEVDTDVIKEVFSVSSNGFKFQKDGNEITIDFNDLYKLKQLKFIE